MVLKQSPVVGTFQCPTHGAALKHWWALLGSTHYYRAEEVSHYPSMVVERSRDI